MANWAKLQEDLTGLPVVKRARHGIHFKRADGQIEAHFSGKPCHYEDNGVWKPIDTTLLLGADGFYGCPHSPVKVHKDGRVKVDKSDYSQFTKLPGSPIGKVDGNRIVREFPGGYQELFVTEDGFREVITVVKRTFPIEKFLAKQSGTLPSAYKTSPQTAVDANGDVFEITSDTKAFGDWLEGAAYPVVIDPDFAVTSGVGGDTTINTAIPTSSRGSATTIQVSTGDTKRKGLIRFDLSSVSAGSTATAAALKLTSAAIYTATVTYDLFKIADANGDWIPGTTSLTPAPAGEPCWNAKKADGSGGVTTAWAGSVGCSSAGTDFINTVLATYDNTSGDYDLRTNTQYDWNFNSSGLTVLNSYFGQSSNNGFLFTQSGTVQTSFHSGNATTESYRPVLSVTYTAGSTGVPKQYLHYARLRSN